MLNQPSPLQLIEDELFTKRRIRLFVKRDDLIHPQISGTAVCKYMRYKKNIQNYDGDGEQRAEGGSPPLAVAGHPCPSKCTSYR